MPAFSAPPMSSPGTPTIRSPKALPPMLPMASEAPKPSPVSGASPMPGEFWLHSELPVALRPVAEPSRTWTTPWSTVVTPSSSGTPIARSAATEPPRSPTASEEPKRSPASGLSAMPGEYWLQVCEPVPVSPVAVPLRTCTMPASVAGPDILVGHADHQLARHRGGVEVAGGKRRAEVVARLGVVADPRRGLRPLLAPRRGQAARAPVEDVHRAGAAVLARRADREVGEAIAVEVAHSQGPAEVVAGLSVVSDSGGVLRPELRARRGEPGRAARRGRGRRRRRSSRPARRSRGRRSRRR